MWFPRLLSQGIPRSCYSPARCFPLARAARRRVSTILTEPVADRRALPVARKTSKRIGRAPRFASRRDRSFACRFYSPVSLYRRSISVAVNSPRSRDGRRASVTKDGTHGETGCGAGKRESVRRVIHARSEPANERTYERTSERARAFVRKHVRRVACAEAKRARERRSLSLKERATAAAAAARRLSGSRTTHWVARVSVRRS